MIAKQTTKILSDTYLYAKANYGREMYNYLMSSTVIDKYSDSFSDIEYQVKIRQVSPVIMKVLMSESIVLCTSNKPMARPFKVFRAKNIKESRDKQDRKVFIDCTDLIVFDGGTYKCKNIQHLLSYLITAMTYVLYYAIPDKLVRNTNFVQAGTEAFVDMMLYVLGYLKIPVTYADNREKMSYALALYYQRCILCKSDMNVISQMAKKVSKLDPKKCAYLDTIFGVFFGEKPYVGIDEFIAEFARVFLNQEKTTKDPNRLSVDTLIDRWMYAFGPSTIFGLEFFPSFAQAIIDCYVGGYLNQQNTIEKIVGNNVADFTNTLLDIGSENA